MPGSVALESETSIGGLDIKRAFRGAQSRRLERLCWFGFRRNTKFCSTPSYSAIRPLLKIRALDSNMYVGEGDAKDVIEWFKHNSYAGLAGFFVAGDQQYNKLINDVLANGAVFDIISGSGVDLFLFEGGQKINFQGGGRDVMVKVDALTALSQNEDHYWPVIEHIGEINKSAASVKRIIKASTLATHRLVEILGLDVDDLPSLTLIGRDFDFETKEPKLVLRTRGHADAEFLIEFLRSIRGINERSRKAAMMQIPTEGSIRRDEALLTKIRVEKDALTKFESRIERHARRLCELLKSAGLAIAAEPVGTAIRSAPSSIEGLRSAAAEQGVKEADLLAALKKSETAETLQWLEKARVAAKNAETRMKHYYSSLPSVEGLNEYLLLHESNFAELEALVGQFERKITFKIAVERITQFLKMSTGVLAKTKRLIYLAAAVKSGGASLLS
jgi:hypothetical protein